MKGAEHRDLKRAIAQLEQRRKRQRAGTTAMAVFGLIGFGIMIVPILFDRTPSPVATTQQSPTATTTVDSYEHMPIIAQAAIVYDLTTGQTLYEKNAQSQLPLASLTKLLTMYAAVSTLNPTTPVTMSPEAIAQDGDSGLTTGDTFAFKDIARLALVASSNDAAAAIAETAAKKQAVSNRSLLASAAAAAGLAQTYALNGTGLDIDVNAKVSGGYGSAADIAMLAGALLKKAPDIAHATIEPSITVRDASGKLHTLPNTNQDIVHVPNPLLSKTGYTDLAGGNLAVVFDAGINHPVAVVVLGSTHEGRFTDVDRLVARTIDHFAGISH
ncbi:MAG: D-alanyl-D-alanine carboxypeptidase family protein [Bacillota bacterium]